MTHAASHRDHHGRQRPLGRRRAACRARPATRKASSRCACASANACERRIEALTLFAFSSENWGRPSEEVGALMGLFVEALDREVDELHENGVRLRFIGDRQGFPVRLQARMAAASSAPPATRACALQVAVGYGGRWDIVKAARQLAAQCASGALRPPDITDRELRPRRCSWPACRIRTCSSAPAASSASAISCCGTWPIPSCIFCDELWPDFDADGLRGGARLLRRSASAALA